MATTTAARCHSSALGYGRVRAALIPTRRSAAGTVAMKKLVVIGAAVLLCGMLVALLVPMWTMTAGMGMNRHGWTAIVLMLVFCFSIAGGLMLLIFYSAHRGHDDAVHFGASNRDLQPAGPTSRMRPIGRTSPRKPPARHSG